MALMRLALIPLILSVPAFADAISVGVKAGVPLTDVVKTAGDIGGRRFEASRRNLTVGPVLNVRLPFGLGVEFGAMYKQVEQQAGQIEVSTVPSEIRSIPYTKNARSWEFPVVGQYRLAKEGTLQPYVEAGFAFNRLSGVLAPFRTLPASLLKPEAGTETRTGFVTGIGVEMHLPIIRITPGLRYTRYGETQPWLPPANAVDFLVGFTF
jgi:opacity protein-like surface antigen